MLPEKHLDSFADQFDFLREQLEAIGFQELMFFHQMDATVWSQDDRKQDST